MRGTQRQLCVQELPLRAREHLVLLVVLREEAMRSRYRSKDRRRGSKGCSAAAASVQKDGGGDFQRECAKCGDEVCHKRKGGSI